MKKLETKDGVKHCPKCDVVKPIENYTRCKRTSDGVQAYCKECRSFIAKEQRAKRSLAQVLRDKERELVYRIENKSARKLAIRNCKIKNPERYAKYNAEYRKIAPHKAQARNLIALLLKEEKLSRGPCQICGEVKTEGHHSDYNYPDSVMWLCKDHHAAWHRVFRAEELSV